jgi:hypothetical protein
MRALSECRLEHVGRFDRVRVECGCGRTVLLEASAFNSVPVYPFVLDLKRRLRSVCRGDSGHNQVGVDAELALDENCFLVGQPDYLLLSRLRRPSLVEQDGTVGTPELNRTLA